MIYPQPDWLTKDEHGIQMPWYTRPCLEVLDKMDFKGKRVFEYGVGYSTIWYRSRGATSWGVDSNEVWAKATGSYFTTDKIPYLTHIGKAAKSKGNVAFDIICIDGLFRDECTEYALKHVATGGMIIIDNYKQPSVDPDPNAWVETDRLTGHMRRELYKEPEHPDWATLIIYP